MEANRNCIVIKMIYIPQKFENEIMTELHNSNYKYTSKMEANGYNYTIFGHQISFIYGLDEIKINDNENNTLEYFYQISHPATTIQLGNYYINNLNDYQKYLVD